MEDEDLDYLPPPAGRALPMAFAAYMGSIVLALIAFSIVQEGDQRIKDLGGSEFFAVNLPAALALAAAAFTLAAPGGDPLRALRLRDPRWSGIVIGLVVGGLAQLALVPLYKPILWWFDGDVGAAAEELTAQFSNSELWLLVLLVVVIAPCAEELFFRGFIQGSLERSTRPVIAVPVAAIVFAAVHLQWLQLPGLFLFGLISGVLLVRYQRLSVSIAAHVGFNSVGVVGLLADRLG